MSAQSLVSQVIHFIEQCRLEPDSWKFSSTPGGPETLYASCFACMSLHYMGELEKLDREQKGAWAAYINSFQDPETGYFIGPELVSGELHSEKHSYEHLAQHLAAHVLPTLHLLGKTPIYPLSFAQPYTDAAFLKKWLVLRDWRDAWLEGNNLLFIGQFMIHLRDVEKIPEAQAGLDLLFDWLNQEQDPNTGLWGSNGACSLETALYGGYHQLLLYYYENCPVRYPGQLIDAALSLQHGDGGFHPYGGGGACEDTDAIDILVNMYKAIDYKRPHVRAALRRALAHILSMQMQDGGFVYRRGEPFIHMGIEKTASGADQSNLFPTWFRVHTLALMAEILVDEPAIQWDWQFNKSCSMGWHRPWIKLEHPLSMRDRREERWFNLIGKVKREVRGSPKKLRRLGGKMKRRLLQGERNG